MVMDCGLLVVGRLPLRALVWILRETPDIRDAGQRRTLVSAVQVPLAHPRLDLAEATGVGSVSVRPCDPAAFHVRRSLHVLWDPDPDGLVQWNTAMDGRARGPLSSARPGKIEYRSISAG